MIANDYIFNNITLLSDFTIRLVLAAVLGSLVGIERQMSSKDAGLKTHMLVSVGSALIMVVSQFGFFEVIQNHISADPSRIAAQVVSGIGFLGAGVIFKEHGSIKGLSTAAGLWCVSGIGLAVGAGLYSLSIIATVLILIAFGLLNKVSKNFYNLHIEIQIKATDNVELEIKNEILKTKSVIISHKVINDTSSKIFNFKIKSKKHEDVQTILHGLESLDNVSLDFYEIL